MRNPAAEPTFSRGAKLLALLLLACPACLPRAGEVYKSIDAEGHVVYSDRAPTSTAQKSVVRVDQPDPSEVARLVKEQQILKAEEIQRNRQKTADDKKQALQDHEHQVQCDNARNHYYSMKDARRIFQRDADGNRTYYTDQEADAKREEARLAMTAACGT
ncbi:MAG: DUF4124 domain-containing protein [Steroidobacteraceae bacterium]